MTKADLTAAADLEGRVISIALVGGDRIDDCHLVALPRDKANNVWVYSEGDDVLLPAEQVLALWETQTKATAP